MFGHDHMNVNIRILYKAVVLHVSFQNSSTGAYRPSEMRHQFDFSFRNDVLTLTSEHPDQIEDRGRPVYVTSGIFAALRRGFKSRKQQKVLPEFLVDLRLNVGFDLLLSRRKLVVFLI